MSTFGSDKLSKSIKVFFQGESFFFSQGVPAYRLAVSEFFLHELKRSRFIEDRFWQFFLKQMKDCFPHRYIVSMESLGILFQ